MTYDKGTMLIQCQWAKVIFLTNSAGTTRYAYGKNESRQTLYSLQKLSPNEYQAFYSKFKMQI